MTIRDILNLEDDLLEEELEDLDRDDLLALVIAVRAIDAALDQELAKRSTSLEAIGGLYGED